VGDPVRGAYETHEVHPEVFSAQECDRIVALGLGLVDSTGALEGDDAALTDRAVRDARIAWIPATIDTAWIGERITAVVDDANERYGFDLSGIDEDLQFTTYDREGSFYTWHQDGLDGPVAHRKLSVVVQLSDPVTYRGAALELFQVVEDYDDEELAEFHRLTRERGTAVVFPAFEYHRVTPLVRGTRHSLVSWVGGPPFR